MADETTAAGHGAGAASHFLVELGDGQYAFCERLAVIVPGADSIPPQIVEELFRKHPLRAVAVPTAGGGRHWDQLTAAFQSGRAPQVNVNIYNQPKD